MTNMGQICYPKNFLSAVVVRVDLIAPVTQLEQALPPALAKLAAQRFPIQEPREAFTKSVQFEMGGAIQSREERFKEWLFHGRDRSKTLTIGRQAIIVEIRKYETYESLEQDIVAVLNETGRLFPDAQVGRLGLRYINKIERAHGDPLEWGDWFDARLLELNRFSREADAARQSRVLHHLEFALDSFKLRIVCGVANPDYPAALRQNQFVLDYDAYTDFAMPLGEVEREMRNLHEAIQEYFELCITPKFRAVLNG